jgi:hypothetical protein
MGPLPFLALIGIDRAPGFQKTGVKPGLGPNPGAASEPFGRPAFFSFTAPCCCAGPTSARPLDGAQ